MLDSSALLALMLEETGADIVKAAITGAMISSVNLGEAAQRAFVGEWSRAEFEGVIDTLKIRTIAVDDGLAIDAAELFLPTRPAGLSFGDRACLALAKREGVAAMTADRRWKEVEAAVGVELRLIR